MRVTKSFTRTTASTRAIFKAAFAMARANLLLHQPPIMQISNLFMKENIKEICKTAKVLNKNLEINTQAASEKIKNLEKAKLNIGMEALMKAILMLMFLKVKMEYLLMQKRMFIEVYSEMAAWLEVLFSMQMVTFLRGKSGTQNINMVMENLWISKK